MNVSTHAVILSCVMQDPKDRSFIQNVKKHIDNILSADEEYKDSDLLSTAKLLDDVLVNNIVEKKEIIYNISSIGYSDALQCLLDDSTNYSKSFKKNLLVRLNATAITSGIKGKVDKVNRLIEKAELSDGKSSDEAVKDLIETLDELGKISFNFRQRMKSSQSTLLIIDPEEGSRGTIGSVVDELKQAVSNKIKTLPVIDGFVGGGFSPKSFNMLAAIGGGGKSLTLQNLLFYASRENSPSAFDLGEGLKPCLVYVSLEMSKKQLYLRQLNWCGVRMTEDEIKGISEDDLERFTLEKAREAGFKIPIVYIVRQSENGPTTALDIEDEHYNLINAGYQPVMYSIDYLDRLDIAASQLKFLGMSGADGSVRVRQKGRELKELASKLNLPVVSAAQLDASAQAEITKCSPFFRQVDVLHSLGLNMLSGSKVLQTECETIIFQHIFRVENKTQEGDILESHSFCTFSVLKDRDGVSKYYLSERDKKMESEYRRSTQKLKNTVAGQISEVFKKTDRLLTVIPLHGFKLDESDYAMSIRVYYPSDKSDFVSLKDMMTSFGDSNDGLTGMGFDDMGDDYPVMSPMEQLDEI